VRGQYGYEEKMPTYDYECKECGYVFEKFQSMSEEALTVCPECKKDTLRRLIGGGLGIIFKGSGFYVNDAKGKSSTSGPVKKSESSSGSKSSANS
jgi:putative FmdB family regulatory protein